MTRADVLKTFPDATDEQITALLNQYNTDIKSKTDKAKEDSERAKELQAKLDEIEKQNMTDIEKANSERDNALNSVAELQAKMAQMELRTKLAEKGITGEDADNLFKDGSLDIETLGKIISDRENAAATNKEKELAGKASNPGGGNPNNQDTKTNAEKVAESVIANNTPSKGTADIVNAYL